MPALSDFLIIEFLRVTAIKVVFGLTSDCRLKPQVVLHYLFQVILQLRSLFLIYHKSRASQIFRHISHAPHRTACCYSIILFGRRKIYRPL